MSCDSCSHSFQVDKRELGTATCPECGGSRFRLVSGREYFIKNIEVV